MPSSVRMSLAERRRSSLIMNSLCNSSDDPNTSSDTPKIPISPQMQLYPIPMPNVRRQRCISCSDNNDLNSLLQNTIGNVENESTPTTTLYPDVIVTKRSRTQSVCGRIFEDVDTGVVKYFCRSRGHGFITPDSGDPELFLHISDVEGAFVPRKGDKVSYRLCPIPPRFDKFQAVHVHILNLTNEEHHRWETPETPEELEEQKEINSLPYDV